MNKRTLRERWEHEKIPKKIISAFFSIDRKKFMLPSLKEFAYEDNAFPIDCEQTISQPTTIINMLALLDPQENDIILEVGTGSGFNAAVLSRLCRQVYTIEIISELAEKARKALKELKIKNVKVIAGNGYNGYKEKSPYDKIIITAAADEIPRALKEQLKENGMLVVPLGRYSQQMKRCIKEKGELHCSSHGEYLFVELKKVK